MVIAEIYVMARRRKGAAGSKTAPAKARVTRGRKANGVQEEESNGALKCTVEESSTKPPDEKHRPLSCRTPMEVCPADPSHAEPPPVILPTPQHVPIIHKKFGKFRCLLEAESPEFQQNCTAIVKEEKVVEEIVEPQEEVVINHVGEETAAEVMIEAVEGEEEVLWEEVVEETVVCETMEMGLEDTSNQEVSRIAEDADSQESDYSGLIEVRDSDYASQDEQAVIVRESELGTQEIVCESDIPHTGENGLCDMVVRTESERSSGLQVVEQVVLTSESAEVDNGSGSLRILDERSQESEISVRGVEMEVETEEIEEEPRCVVYRDVMDNSIGSDTPDAFEGQVKPSLMRCSEENFRVLGEMFLGSSDRNISHNDENVGYYDSNKLNNSRIIYTDNCAYSSLGHSDQHVNSHLDRLSPNVPNKLQNMVDLVERIVAKELNVSEVDDQNTVEDGGDREELVKSEDDYSETKPVCNTFRSRSGSTDTTGSESGSNSSTGGIRRSHRIRSIGIQKQRSFDKSEPPVDTSDVSEVKVATSDSGISECCSSVEAPPDLTSKVPVPLSSPAPTLLVPAIPAIESTVDLSKPVKVKSRWRRSSELEMGGKNIGDSEVIIPPPAPSASPRPVQQALVNLPAPTSVTTLSPIPDELAEDMPLSEALAQKEAALNEKAASMQEEVEKLRNFVFLRENEYHTDRSTSKEAKRMVCDCFLTKEEWSRGDMACGEDCLNRLLMIECGSRCTMGDRCSNKRFQKQEYSKCEIFKTEKKGFGLKALCDLPAGSFIMEYVGEVLDPKEFRRRAKDYSKEKNRHYYFMALKSDAIIDATMKGNNSRFINHSCDPNSETQKWTVNGELRIGFFCKRSIAAGEEVTFDYQLQRYGKEAQRCHCEAANCRGWIGEDPEKERRERKERKEREVKKKKEEKKKDVKEFLDDMDLEEEIEKLSASGLKNRAHTLTLCRLMVRAEDRESRVQLLKLIQEGETACRRLFLDYHGLRLVWSWMMDVGSANSEEELELRTEILKALAKLPILNKTMVQDSKVLNMVEKWLSMVNNSESVDSIALEFSTDSIKKENSSMEVDQDPGKKDNLSLEIDPNAMKKEVLPQEFSEISIKKEDLSEDSSQDSHMKETKADSLSEYSSKQEIEPMELSEVSIKKEGLLLDDESNGSDRDIKPRTDGVLPAGVDVPDEESVQGLESEKQVVDSTPELSAGDVGLRRGSESDDEGGYETPNNPDKRQVFIKLASRLLSEWNNLKEVFRIPKKERIEQMKEHEREADRGYKEYLDKGGQQAYDRHRRQDRFRSDPDKRKRTRESPEPDRARKGLRFDERSSTTGPRMSKHERRHLFALKVAQEEEEERHRRQQQEMWRQHEDQCLALGMNPSMTAAIDPQTGYPCFFDPATGTWQSYPPQDPNPMPSQDVGPSPVFNPNHPHSPHLPHGIPPHSQGGHHGPSLPHGPSPHGPPLLPTPPGPPIPHTPSSHGPALLPTPNIPPIPQGPTYGHPPHQPGPPHPHGLPPHSHRASPHAPPYPIMSHKPSLLGPGPAHLLQPHCPPYPHGPPQGPPHPHSMPPQGPLHPHSIPPQGPPHPHSIPPQGPPHPHSIPPQGPPHPHSMPPQGPPPPHSMPPHGPPLPHSIPPQGPPLPHSVPPQGPPLPHSMPLQGPPLPQSMPPQRPPLPQGMPPQGPPIPHGVPPQGPPLPHGMPPQGPPHPHSIPPQGLPHPHGMPPQGPPHPHGIPPQGPPLSNGIPPHSYDVSPYGMQSHNYPPHTASPHHTIPSHGVPNHGLLQHVVQAPLQPESYDPNQQVPYDPNNIQQQHVHPASHDTNNPHPLGSQPVFQQPSAQQVYAPQPGASDSQYQVLPVQHPTYAQPIQLPPKWKSAKDSEGRVYYYHVKTRVSQWEVPQWTQVSQQPESETSSESSDDDDDEEEEEEEEEEESSTAEEDEQEEKVEEDEEEEEEEEPVQDKDDLEEEDMVLVNPDESSITDPIEEAEMLLEAVGPSKLPLPIEEDTIKKEKKRDGLVQERIISPRGPDEHSENNNKKYKENKEKMRRKKEQKRAQEKNKKRHEKSRSEKPVTVAADTSSDAASRRIKDQFRLQMASVIVQFLNPYRKPDCKIGRIRTTEDFKHVARKLTHFVMLKELKHCRNVNDLECNENVKHKAKDFVRKYMAKYGPVYIRPKDELT